jgi:hypothetical protein
LFAEQFEQFHVVMNPDALTKVIEEFDHGEGSGVQSAGISSGIGRGRPVEEDGSFIIFLHDVGALVVEISRWPL